MRRRRRSFTTIALALASVVALSACGSSSKTTSTSQPAGTSSTTSAAAKGGTISLVMGTAPDSLDPGMGYTTQAAEPDWLAYTGLTTYAHANGLAGGQLIPGLATALPVISADGTAPPGRRPRPPEDVRGRPRGAR